MDQDGIQGVWIVVGEKLRLNEWEKHHRLALQAQDRRRREDEGSSLAPLSSQSGSAKLPRNAGTFFSISSLGLLKNLVLSKNEPACLPPPRLSAQLPPGLRAGLGKHGLAVNSVESPVP